MEERAIGGRCTLPNGGGQECFSVDSAGVIVQCNCDEVAGGKPPMIVFPSPFFIPCTPPQEHSARCWREADGKIALQRVEGRGKGSLRPQFGAHVALACADSVRAAAAAGGEL